MNFFKPVLTFIFLLSLAFADDCTKSDYWDPTSKMTEGDFRGECIFTGIQRPAKILFQDAKQIVFANFRHNKKFYIAVLEANSVKSVTYHQQSIKNPDGTIVDGIHHVYASFELSLPLKLVWEQGASNVSKEDIEEKISANDYISIDNLIFSVEAGRVFSNRNEAWSINQKPGSYPLVERLASLESLKQDEFDQPNKAEAMLNYSHLRNRERISDAEISQKILVGVINRSHEKGIRETYHIALKNCSNETLRALDVALKPYYSPPLLLDLQSLEQNIKDSNPEWIIERLQYRGLVAP